MRRRTSESEIQNKYVTERALLVGVDDIADENARGGNGGTKAPHKRRNRNTPGDGHGETVAQL